MPPAKKRITNSSAAITAKNEEPVQGGADPEGNHCKEREQYEQQHCCLLFRSLWR